VISHDQPKERLRYFNFNFNFNEKGDSNNRDDNARRDLDWEVSTQFIRKYEYVAIWQ
jgi:hypothetical protein